MEIKPEDIPKKFDIGFVDADVLKYHAGFAAEKTLYHLYDDEDNFIDTFHSADKVKEHLEELSEFLMVDVSGYRKEPEKVIGSEEHAINACDLIVKSFMEKCPCDQYKFYLSGKNNFRDGVATLYKYCYPRDNTPKPYWINSIVEHIKNEYSAITTEGLEGDDQVSVGVYTRTKKGQLAVHLGIDKDVKYGTMGWHYDWQKDEFIYTTAEEGLLFVYQQAVAGDLTDGFHGIPKIGMKKAYNLLKDCKTEREMYEVAVKAYRKKFGDLYEYTSWRGEEMKKTPEELFLENMQLAWILKEKNKFYKVPEKPKKE